MRLQLRSTVNQKSTNNTKRDVAARLRELAAKRGKLSEKLREVQQSMMSAQGMQNAGLLAHYALLALILGNLIKGAQKKYIEKQLEKLGKKEMDYNEKLEHLNDLDKNTKAISDLHKKIDHLPDDQKALIEPELKEAEAMRDVIAKKLGLSDEELGALTKTFNTHHEKMEKEQPLEGSIDAVKGLQEKAGDSLKVAS